MMNNSYYNPPLYSQNTGGMGNAIPPINYNMNIGGVGQQGGIMENYYNPYLQQQAPINYCQPQAQAGYQQKPMAPSGYIQPNAYQQQQDLMRQRLNYVPNQPMYNDGAQPMVDVLQSVMPQEMPFMGTNNNSFNPYAYNTYMQDEYKKRVEEKKSQLAIWKQLSKGAWKALTNVSDEEIAEHTKKYDFENYEMTPNGFKYINKTVAKKEEIKRPDKKTLVIRIYRDNKLIVDTSKSTAKSIYDLSYMYQDSDESIYAQLAQASRYGVDVTTLTRRSNVNFAEIEKNKKIYGNMSMVEFFNNAGTLLFEAREYERRAERALSIAQYDHNAFQRRVQMGADQNPYTCRPGVVPDYLKSSIKINDVNDLEITLPPELKANSERTYDARRQQFINTILANARRVGTDITMGGAVPIE